MRKNVPDKEDDINNGEISSEDEHLTVVTQLPVEDYVDTSDDYLSDEEDIIDDDDIADMEDWGWNEADAPISQSMSGAFQTARRSALEKLGLDIDLYGNNS